MHAIGKILLFPLSILLVSHWCRKYSNIYMSTSAFSKSCISLLSWDQLMQNIVPHNEAHHLTDYPF